MKWALELSGHVCHSALNYQYRQQVRDPLLSGNATGSEHVAADGDEKYLPAAYTESDQTRQINCSWTASFFSQTTVIVLLLQIRGYLTDLGCRIKSFGRLPVRPRCSAPVLFIRSVASPGSTQQAVEKFILVENMESNIVNNVTNEWANNYAAVLGNLLSCGQWWLSWQYVAIYNNYSLSRLFVCG